MKSKQFLDAPGTWTKAPRASQSPADYANAVQRFDTPDSIVLTGCVLAALALTLVVAVWG